MKFSAIVSNPPYQIMDGGFNTSAMPVYNKFVDLARDISPDILSMIMPIRWCVAGRGLEDFRHSMLKDSHLVKLYDFADGGYVFPGIRIGGGIGYFLWDKKYDSPYAEIVNQPHQPNQLTSKRPKLEFNLEFLIRNNMVHSVYRKVFAANEVKLSSIAFSQKPFGFRTNFKDFEETGEIKLYTKQDKKGFGYVSLVSVTKNQDHINDWKVVTSRTTSVPEEDNGQVLRESQTFISEPNSVVSESYVVIGSFKDKSTAENCLKYIKTRFVRVLCQVVIVSADVSARTFDLVPLQDFTSSSDIDWSKSVAEIDQQLYDKYGLTQEERDFIESMIKPME